MKKDEQLGVSRRSFLKGAGLAAAAMAGTAALAGCANESAGGTDTLANTGDWLPQTWDYECDLLVIGYGGAGMWASLIGADECGQQVLVLEKAPERGGGNSSINNGEWTIVEESEKERFKDYIRAFTKGKTPDPMIEAWVEECARNTEYADKYGMTYEVVEQALAGAIPEYFFLDDNAYEGSCKLSSVDGFGMLSFHELDAQREALGVEVLFDCHDERLIQNPQTKEIVGAYTMIGNEEKTVKARKMCIRDSVMSDMVSSAFGSLAMMTSALVSPAGVYEYEAAHGTVQRHYYKHLEGKETSTNSVATIFAWSGALRKRGELDELPDLVAFADRLEAATLATIEAGEMTGDLARITTLPNPTTLSTGEFIRAIARRLAA